MKFNRILFVSLFCVFALASIAQAQKTLMTFTSIKGAGAKKDWVADTCYAAFNASKTLTITGQFATGRTDIPYQAMVITIKNFSELSSTVIYKITDAYLEDIFTVGGSPTRVKTTIVANYTNQAYVTDYDDTKGLLKGTFFFKMTSHPPVGDEFDTQVTVGKFEASISPDITLDAAPTKTVQINTGNKVNYKVYAKNVFGQNIEGADIYVSDEIAKTKDVKVGVTSSAGEYVYTVDIPKETNSKVYKVSFTAKKKTGEGEISSNVVDRNLDVSGRYWVYNCANVPIMTFDAGEGKEWKSDDPLPTITASGKIIINEILTCEGTVTIDPREGKERVSGSYSMYIDGVSIAGSNTRLPLHEGIGMIMNCSKIMKWDTPGIIKKKIGGIEFSIDEISFADLNFAKTVKLKGSATWANLYKDNCTIGSDQPQSSSITVGMIIGYEELAGFKIEALEASATNLSTAALPGFCIDNAAFSYDPVKDAFTVSTAVEYSTPNPADASKKLFEGKAKVSLTIEKGRFEAMSIEGKVKPGMIIPDVPFTWNGLKISTSGWSNQTSWKGVSAELSGFFNSDDQLFKDKFPGLGKILGNDPFCEVELNGKFECAGPKVTARATGRFMSVKTISVTKKWQIELSSKAVLDIGHHNFEFGQCDLKAFHFGLDDFFISTSTPPLMRFSFGESGLLFYSSVMSATVRIPDYPSEPANAEKWGAMYNVLKYLKSIKALPRTLGTASLSFKVDGKDVEAAGMVDVTTCGIPLLSSYGSLGVKIGVNENGPHMSFSGAFKGLVTESGKMKGAQIQSAASNDETIQAAPIDTFTVTDNTLRAFVLMSSKTKVPASVLISPSGEKISATKSDSSVILFDGGDGTFAQWSIIDPEKGKWILQLTNPAPTDSISLFSLNKEKPFEVTAAATGKNITVNWNASNYDAADYVDIYIDNKQTGYNGIYMGRAPANTGTFTFVLSDSLEKCSYYVYAQRQAIGTAPATVYATGQFTVDKPVTTPNNIIVTSNQHGAVRVNFSVNPDPNIYRYAAYISKPDGFDSLIAVTYPSETMMEFTCDTALLKSLFIISENKSGVRSCPGIPQSITVGVEEDPKTGLTPGNPFVIIPNPSSTSAILRFTLRRTGETKVLVTNILGQKVTEIPSGSLGEGIHELTYNTSSLCEGMYMVRIISEYSEFSTFMTVIR
ncbi:MAG: T9SS type A sorting domain-containing protein [Ignavibacteriae bacterium]|nr:T9SS type A sorting domain-containing protein [Ignavibacteriota bacterium]